jgi:hypothetical protein
MKNPLKSWIFCRVLLVKMVLAIDIKQMEQHLEKRAEKFSTCPNMMRWRTEK